MTIYNNTRPPERKFYIMSMYTKDKNHRVTLRLNDAQFQFVTANADILEVSPSDFLRMVINAALASDAKMREMQRAAAQTATESFVEDYNSMRKDGKGRENDKAGIDNQF